MPGCFFTCFLLPNTVPVLPSSDAAKRCLRDFSVHGGICTLLPNNLAIYCPGKVCSKVFQSFLPFLCWLIIFRLRVAEQSLLLSGLGEEVKVLTCSHSQLPTDSVLHATTSQWKTRLHCMPTPTPFPRSCYGWDVPWHPTGMILDGFFCYATLDLLEASSSGKSDHVACLVKRERAMTDCLCAICHSY